MESVRPLTLTAKSWSFEAELIHDKHRASYLVVVKSICVSIGRVRWWSEGAEKLSLARFLAAFPGGINR